MLVLMAEIALAGTPPGGRLDGPPGRDMLFEFGEGIGIDVAVIGRRLWPYEMADISSIVSSGEVVRSSSFLAPDRLSISSRSELIFFKTC